jgi:hypothetical protein
MHGVFKGSKEQNVLHDRLGQTQHIFYIDLGLGSANVLLSIRKVHFTELISGCAGFISSKAERDSLVAQITALFRSPQSIKASSSL